MLSTPNSNANITTFSSRYSESKSKNMCILSKIVTNISSYETAQKWSRCTKNLTNSHDFETPRSSFGQNITKMLPRTYCPTLKIVRVPRASKISTYECINTWRSSTFEEAFILLHNRKNVKILLKNGRIM